MWIPPTPPAVTPVAAATATDSLRGRRVVVGVPGQGWRADLRADDRVRQGGRTFVPVLAEHDYYRSELEDLEVFAPLVPIDRVWVEQPAESRAADDDMAALGHGLLVARLVMLDAPPPREPVPVAEVPAVTGRRLVRAIPDGVVRDLRAASEPYENAAGTISLRICPEPEWYRWAMTGQPPTIEEAAVDALWVE